jgi:catechol 2,3-dioxygenase-like lactoylglutathione lyase family enzyme
MRMWKLALPMALAASFLAGRGSASLAPPASPDRERVTGIGGVFFKAKDPQALGAWYRDHLGLALLGEPSQPFSAFLWRDRDDQTRLGTTVWAVFPQDTRHFAPSQAPFMVNYRVADLNRLLAQLRAQGVAVEERVVEDFNGRFAWLADPEGNRIELWEPKPGF